MGKNDPTQDRYNPPGVTEHEWERKIFHELQDGEVFHQSNKPDAYAPVWRKEGASNQALNLKTQKLHNWDTNAPIFVRL
jgi:hypothetical protein